jgi:hypothetical protein
MTLQVVVSACCAMFVLGGSAQAQPACATEAQRKIEIEKLIESVDWFLSIVEEVPEGIARQFRAARLPDEMAFRQAFAHPLWRAHKVRDTGADIKRALHPSLPDMPEDRLRVAIFALRRSASFSLALSDYLDHDRGRIIDVQGWAYRYTVLPANLERYARGPSTPSFDYLVGTHKNRCRHGDTNRLGGDPV